MKPKGIHVFVAVIVLAVAAAVVNAFFTIGSPTQERARRLDQQRVNDLQQISSSIDQYYNLNQRHLLPETLEALRQERNVYVGSIADPKTGQPYEYRRTGGDMSYELCATFETEAIADPQKPYAARPYPDAASGTNFWSHGVGRVCFDLTVQKWPVVK